MRHKNKKMSIAAATNIPTTRFGVDFANIRGIHSNLRAVHHHLETAKPAMLFLTETQILRPTDQSYLHYPGYVLEESFKAKAGVCLFVRSDVCCRRLRLMEDPSFSVLWVHVDLGFSSKIYVCLYRSHQGDQETTRLFEYLSRVTDEAQEQFPSAEMVFLGDFNAHHESWLKSPKTDHAGRTAHAFALTYDLTQVVNDTTRIPDVTGHRASLLDLLLTTNPLGYEVSVRAPLGSSDHCLVSTVVSQAASPGRVNTKRKLWHYVSADWDGLREYFASVPWGQRCFLSDDPSKCAAAIADEIVIGMEYYIPSSMAVSGGSSKPWYDKECSSALAAKNVAYRAWASARASGDHDIHHLKAAYNSASKSVKKALIRADAQRIARIGKDLVAHPTGSRGYWRLAKSVQANFCRSSLPSLRLPNGSLAHTAKSKADLLAKLFAENSTLNDNGAVPPCLPHCGLTMPDVQFRHCDVRAELLSIDTRKASGPDGIPATVLKNCAAELSPVLTRLYRLSYSTGQVPGAWKEANVQPVPKKGDRSDPANYRPIAVTSVLCKVMERIINTKLIRYLEDHSLINDRQYGFRPNRSTGDLLAYVTHVWGDTLDKFGESVAVSLDISKAFDRVWHKALISKLSAYGLPSKLCDWLCSFLHKRRLRVLVDGFASELMQVNAGVPQGSVLSPTLFLLHINDMLSLGNIHCYADDSTVHGGYTSRPSAGYGAVEQERQAVIAELDGSLAKISDWGKKNLVGFNAKKNTDVRVLN